jgi:hypothetical protein
MSNQRSVSQSWAPRLSAWWRWAWPVLLALVPWSFVGYLVARRLW